MLQPANNASYRPKHHLRSLFLLVLWLALLGATAYNRQSIIDWWRLRDYHAPAAIAQLASQDTMTAYGRKIFYVNNATLDSKTAFSQQCPNNGGEQTIVLGCYHSNQAGIFLLGVTDPRLDGVEQVTAAHEMLHGAYDRLSGSQKQKVDVMLQDYYDHGLHDPRILATMALYKKTEPKDVVNEMHSVFGTEIAKLPAGLEQYYQRYFTNRSQIAAYGAQYEAEFTSRQTMVSQDDAQLAAQKQQIDNTQADLKAKQAVIAARQSSLTALRANGDISGYNAGVPVYNALIDDYNAEVAQIRALTGQYNALVASRNSVALEEDQLIKELTSNNATIQQ
jgi:hypothetical protein